MRYVFRWGLFEFNLDHILMLSFIFSTLMPLRCKVVESFSLFWAGKTYALACLLSSKRFATWTSRSIVNGFLRYFSISFS